jgi:hypothetical protein
MFMFLNLLCGAQKWRASERMEIRKSKLAASFEFRGSIFVGRSLIAPRRYESALLARSHVHHKQTKGACLFTIDHDSVQF